MFGRQPKFKYMFLVLDLVLTTICFWWAAFSAFQEGYRPEFRLAVVYTFLIGVFIYFLQYNGMYKRHIIVTGVEQTWYLLKSALYSLFFILFICLLFSTGHAPPIFKRDFIIRLFLILLVAEFFFRVVMAREIFLFLARKNFYRPTILIVGGDNIAIKVAKSLFFSSLSSYNVVGFIDDTYTKDDVIFEDLKNLGSLDEIQNVVRQYKVDEIIIAMENVSYNQLIDLVQKCLSTGVVVRIHSPFMDIIGRLLDVERYENIPVVMLSPSKKDGKISFFKRTFDQVISLIGIIILLPVFLGIAAGIKLSSPGPVFYTQNRIGRNGRPFKFYKFRSMHVGNDSDEHKAFVQNFIKDSNTCEPNDIRVFKITHDPRIFPFGHFIRKTSLDEFPQLFNVIKGDMSLVGPRPCLPYEWDCYDDWHKNRLNVLPGCTGLWQALGRSSVTFEEMVVLDLFYVNNVAVRNDIKIMIQTIPAILFGKGAY